MIIHRTFDPDQHNFWPGYKYVVNPTTPAWQWPKGNPINLEYTTSTHADEAVKHDQNKPDLSLLSSIAILELAKVLSFGAQKYSAHNWRNGFEFSRPYSACLRHLLAWNAGENTDPESGLNHLAHAMCNLMFLLELQQTRPDLDNRHNV